MNPQINPSPTPKKVAFSPVRLGPSDSQTGSGTPPSVGKSTPPRSILKTSNSPIYNHDNDVSVVLDNSARSPINGGSSGTNLELYIQRLLLAKGDEKLYAYSSLYSALKQDPNTSNVNEDLTRSALDMFLNDMKSSESIVIKQTSVRCLGFTLNYSTLVNHLGVSDISAALNAIVTLLSETQAKSIYTLCVWCLAIQRISKRMLDPHVPLVTKAAISALTPRLKSAKAQMEALAALDYIFGQDPSRFSAWANICFSTIVQCLTHPISPLRRKAAVILTKMLPKIWNEPSLLSSAIQTFLRDHATKFTDEMTKMIEESPEDHDTMQIWALMIMITGSSLHRSRFLNGMIRVAEKSFQCRRSDSNVNTFKAWNALIFNFRLKNHLLHENRLRLVKLPLEAGLKEEKHVSVRVAATRTWISLVYACNEDFHQQFVFNSAVRDFASILSKDKSPVILDLLYNTLAALMNGHTRKTSRTSLMNVFIRGMDLQPADLLAVPPAIIREHHNVIMDTLKSGIGQAAMKLDNQAELSIKKSYMEAWQALIRTYRDLYQKEIRPSSAYIEAIHSCLEFLSFVILRGEPEQAFKDRLFIFKHLLKAMMDILTPNFLSLQAFELPMNTTLINNDGVSEVFKDKKFVPIVYCLSIFIVGICHQQQNSYDDFVETVCELSGACRQSSGSILDLVSLIECDFIPLSSSTDPIISCREALHLKLKMACSCIRHEFGSLQGTRCSLPETDEVKQALARLICYPLRHVSVHHKYMFEAATAENYALKCQWLGLFNSIANVVPNGVDDIATHIICIVTEIMDSEGCSKEISVMCWLEFCHSQLSQLTVLKAFKPFLEADVPLDEANIHTVQLGLLNVQEQLRNMVQSQIQELQPSPNLYNAVSGYLSAVVNSISYSQMDTKNRATVVIRHLLGWQETLCYNCSNMDQTLKYKITHFLLDIMAILDKLSLDDHIRDAWARSLLGLITCKDPEVATPFAEKLAGLLKLKSCQHLLQHPSIETILSTLGIPATSTSREQSPQSIPPKVSTKQTSNAPTNRKVVRPAAHARRTTTSSNKSTHPQSNAESVGLSNAGLADVSRDGSQQAGQHNGASAATAVLPPSSDGHDTMVLSPASPLNEPLTDPASVENITISSTAPVTNDSSDSNPKPMVLNTTTETNEPLPQKHYGSPPATDATTAIVNSTSNNTPEPMDSSLSSPIDDKPSHTAHFPSLPSTPNKKRARASEQEHDLLDLTQSPKRPKPLVDEQPEIPSSWSPLPTHGAMDEHSPDAGHAVSVLPVTSLLQKAIDGKTELEQMNVSDLLSCQQMLNQLNIIITDSLYKSLK